jgi:hypothetical protein
MKVLVVLVHVDIHPYFVLKNAYNFMYLTLSESFQGLFTNYVRYINLQKKVGNYMSITDNDFTLEFRPIEPRCRYQMGC